ncbi:MAG TPA: sigma-70 family RNA polymerase sigma factor, partial [Planctomycetota bacterium]|nr:sigma-70 family RNA polymerase sigma factor [Planctomycetota bacterium]
TITRNPDAAEDLTQETFLKALKRRDQFIRGSNLSAWAGRILRNAWLDRLRAGARQPRLADFEAEGIEPSASATPVEAQIRDEAIAGALDRLGPFFRALLVLCDVHGLKYREIAELLGRPMGTVMSGVHRARKRLRMLLDRSLLAAG